METFTMVPRGPFSLASSIRFLEGFTPAAYTSGGDALLELAFPVEASWETVGVRVRQDGVGVNWRPYRTWVTLLLRTQQEVPVAGALNCG